MTVSEQEADALWDACVAAAGHIVKVEPSSLRKSLGFAASTYVGPVESPDSDFSLHVGRRMLALCLYVAQIDRTSTSPAETAAQTLKWIRRWHEGTDVSVIDEATIGHAQAHRCYQGLSVSDSWSPNIAARVLREIERAGDDCLELAARELPGAKREEDSDDDSVDFDDLDAHALWNRASATARKLIAYSSADGAQTFASVVATELVTLGIYAAYEYENMTSRERREQVTKWLTDLESGNVPQALADRCTDHEPARSCLQTVQRSLEPQDIIEGASYALSKLHVVASQNRTEAALAQAAEYSGEGPSGHEIRERLSQNPKLDAYVRLSHEWHDAIEYNKKLANIANADDLYMNRQMAMPLLTVLMHASCAMGEDMNRVLAWSTSLHTRQTQQEVRDILKWKQTSQALDAWNQFSERGSQLQQDVGRTIIEALLRFTANYEKGNAGPTMAAAAASSLPHAYPTFTQTKPNTRETKPHRKHRSWRQRLCAAGLHDWHEVAVSEQWAANIEQKVQVSEQLCSCGAERIAIRRKRWIVTQTMQLRRVPPGTVSIEAQGT